MKIQKQKLNTVQVGDISEAKILTRFVELGYGVLVPWSNGLRYDLVIEKDGVFSRIQVKTGRLNADKSKIMFNTSSLDNSAERLNGWQKNYIGEIDYFAIYCPQTQGTYLMHISQAPKDNCYMRVAPTKNGQKKGIRWAKDFIL